MSAKALPLALTMRSAFAFACPFNKLRWYAVEKNLAAFSDRVGGERIMVSGCDGVLCIVSAIAVPNPEIGLTADGPIPVI